MIWWYLSIEGPGIRAEIKLISQGQMIYTESEGTYVREFVSIHKVGDFPTLQFQDSILCLRPIYICSYNVVNQHTNKWGNNGGS